MHLYAAYGYGLAELPVDLVEVAADRFCVACECIQYGLAGVPCWQCGGVTVGVRPKGWPMLNGPRMRPSEMDDEGCI